MTAHQILTRRQALIVVAGVAGTLYGQTTAAQSGGRTLGLVLDDVQVIEIRYRGRTAAVSPASLIDALSGKEP